MAVVIDEFEVVTESPPPTVSRAEAEMNAPSPEDALTAQEIERITERQMERCARIRAH
jgi:hypothetical protein